jgi:hypothetical protein
MGFGGALTETLAHLDEFGQVVGVAGEINGVGLAVG